MMAPTPDVVPLVDTPDPAPFVRLMTAADEPGRRIALRPEDARDGLGKLVLTLIELIRNLLERQALRRIDAGGLSDAEVERLGLTFLRLSEQVEAMKAVLGLDGEDLNLDLGPLGKLL